MEDKALGDRVDGVLASLDIEHPTARDADTLIDFYSAARAEAFREAAGVDPLIAFCPTCTAEEGDWCWEPPGPAAIQVDFCHHERWRAALRERAGAEELRQRAEAEERGEGEG